MAAELPEAGMVALCVAIGKAIAVELPEPGMVALCSAICKTMAAVLPEAPMVALCVAIAAVAIAVGCREILKPLLCFLWRTPSRGPVLAAVLFITLALPMAYLAFVILLYAPVTVGAAAGAPVALAAFRQYVLLVCAPLVLLFLPFLIFLAAGGW